MVISYLSKFNFPNEAYAGSYVTRDPICHPRGFPPQMGVPPSKVAKLTTQGVNLELCSGQRVRPECRSSAGRRRAGQGVHRQSRSEEHTSELQSLMRISYAVFCLKKKTQIIDNNKSNIQKQGVTN